MIQEFILELTLVKELLVQEEMVATEVGKMDRMDNVHYVLKEHVLL